MSAVIVLTELAREEIREARAWYRCIGPSLGRDFARSIRSTLDRISAFPESYPELTPGVRKARVRRFPYSVVYRLHGEEVVVVALFHSRRDPRLLRARST